VGNRLKSPVALGLRPSVVAAVVLLALRAIGLGDGPPDSSRTYSAAPPAADEAESTAPAADEEPDPIWANAGCYVCHTTFVREEMTKVHLVEKVTCVKCHGLSAAHANDENIGATPPDIRFKRAEVDPMCVECHEEHDASAAKVIARFIERDLPTGQKPICTDCHGTHHIEKADAAEGVPGSAQAPSGPGG